MSISASPSTLGDRVVLLFVASFVSLFILHAAAPSPTGAQSAAREGARAPAVAGESEPRAGAVYLFTERYSLEDGGLGFVDRGYLYVPVRRDRPGSGVLLIDFYRFRRSPDAPADVPPIFRLHGGPGFSGLSDALDDGYFERSVRPLIGISDVVVVGQRGIGSSKPNTRCEGPEHGFPVDAPVSEEERAAQARETSRRCREYWEERGFDLKGLNVLEAAADIDDVRAALGYDRIIVHGASFGSHWGLAYMRRFPDRVERAVLAGLEGPDHTYDMPSWVLAALERVAEDAERSDRLAGQIPEGGLIEAWKDVVRRLEAEPFRVQVADPGSGDTGAVWFDTNRVGPLADGYSSAPDGAHDMAPWPADIIRLHGGDFTAAAEPYVGRTGGGGWPTAAFFMLDCGSGISRERGARLRSDPARRWVGDKARFYDANCPVWDSDLGEEFRRNFESEVPTVMVHGNWDLSTPLENAQELIPFFPKGKLIVVDRGTHGALDEAIEHVEGFAEALREFIRTGGMSHLPDRVELPPVEWVVPDGSDAAATGLR